MWAALNGYFKKRKQIKGKVVTLYYTPQIQTKEDFT